VGLIGLEGGNGLTLMVDERQGGERMTRIKGVRKKLSQNLRAFLSRMLRHGIPGLHVLSYDEIPEDKQIKVVASIGAPLPQSEQPQTPQPTM